jgi:DNA-binding NtrC family response regulator
MKEQFDRLVDHFLGHGFQLAEAVRFLEKGMIVGALERSRGNRCGASKLLGIHRNTLQRKITEFNLDPPALKKKPPRRVRPAAKKARAG